MKVLFICRANVGRSQMAKALYNKLSNSENASSVGTIVDGYNGETGQTLEEFTKTKPHAKNVMIVMNEEGIDVSKYKREQLTEDMLENYDKVIVLLSPQECPDYLIKNPKTEIWDIEDAAGTGYDFHVKTRDQIKSRIKKLIENA